MEAAGFAAGARSRCKYIKCEAVEAKGGHAGLAQATEFPSKLNNSYQRVASPACPLLATLTQPASA